MEEWSFQESYIWSNTFPQCSASKQSPINIDTELIQECKTMCNFDIQYKSTKCFIKNTNGLIDIIVSPGSFLIYDNTPFQLTNIVIHVPSLHSIDSSKSDVEICFIHKLTSTGKSKINGIVLSRLFEKGPNFGKPETFINQIINNIPTENTPNEKQIEVSDDWGPNMLIPETNKSYFTYDGSYHFPPCTDNVKWFIYEDIGKIGAINVDTMINYIGNNVRPIQQLNNRTVFYVVVNEEKKKDRQIFTSDNKYLKCIKTNDIENKVVEENEVTEPVDDNEGFSIERLKQISQILYTIIIILLFVLAYVFVKYLYKHHYFQEFLQVLSGKAIITDAIMNEWKAESCGKPVVQTQTPTPI